MQALLNQMFNLLEPGDQFKFLHYFFYVVYIFLFYIYFISFLSVFLGILYDGSFTSENNAVELTFMAWAVKVSVLNNFMINL